MDADPPPHGSLPKARLGIIESGRSELLTLRRSKQIDDEVQKLVREPDLAELALTRPGAG
jgi:hypothetical protein